VLAGFGFSMLNPSTGKAVLEWFPPRGRGLAMGIKQTGLTLGGLAGALVLPPIALAFGWRHALAAAGALSLVAATLVLALYRTPAVPGTAPATSWPRLTELGIFMRRPGVIVVFMSGLALSTAQSSVLAYLALYAKETFAVSAVAAGQVLALAQLGGTGGRLAWGAASDRFFGGRRRPGVVVSALLGAGAYALFALGPELPVTAVVPLAIVAGAGAFGWVGLYFALVAEIGGARYAGLLTGVAVAFAWSGVLVGPPMFGLLLGATGSYAWPWLALAIIATVVAVTLPQLRPLVQREPA
jgi:MFS family permease